MRYAVRGIGQASTAEQIQAAMFAVGNAVGDPTAAARRGGEAFAQAAGDAIIDPLIDRTMEKITPYVIKYVAIPYAVLLVLAGAGAIFAYRAGKR